MLNQRWIDIVSTLCARWEWTHLNSRSDFCGPLVHISWDRSSSSGDKLSILLLESARNSKSPSRELESDISIVARLLSSAANTWIGNTWMSNMAQKEASANTQTTNIWVWLLYWSIDHDHLNKLVVQSPFDKRLDIEFEEKWPQPFRGSHSKVWMYNLTDGWTDKIKN